MKSKKIAMPSMRILHRYLGFFLAGIMGVYALSGIVLIFRDTDFLKNEQVIEKTLPANLTADELGGMLRLRGFKIEKEANDVIHFNTGTYNKNSGLATYTSKQLPYVLDKLTHLHKASTQQPLYWLNIFFGSSLLFFVISSFWMFLPKTKIFRKSMYFTLAGIVFTLILIFI